MGIIIFALMTFGIICLGCALACPNAETSNTPSKANDGRELLNKRLLKECGRYVSLSDNWTDNDDEKCVSFARARIDKYSTYKQWRFFKVGNNTYAVRINKPSTPRVLDAIITKLDKGTLNGFVPYADYDEYYTTYKCSHNTWSPCYTMVDEDNWAGSYRYTNGSHVHRGYSHHYRYSWTPSVIMDGYAVIKMYDDVLDREYEKKFTLPTEYANICNLKYGVDIIEL